MQPCDELPAFEGSDTDAVFSYLITTIQLYHACKAKQSALGQWAVEVAR